jgi:hypothetical protein
VNVVLERPESLSKSELTAWPRVLDGFDQRRWWRLLDPSRTAR